MGQIERNTVNTNDSFKYHEIAPEVLQELREQLKTFPNLATAHLVQKVVHHFPQEQSYVLGITSKRAWYRSQSNDRDGKLVNELAEQLKFPGFVFIIPLEQNYRPLRKIFERVQGSEIYRAV